MRLNKYFSYRKNKNFIHFLLMSGLFFISVRSTLNALGFPTLSDAPGARATALGEAFSAVSDDITAFHYNPAALSSLQCSQASLYYEKGIVNDTYGQLMAGFRKKNKGIGAFVSYYNEGTLDFYDVDSTRPLQGRKELSVGMGASQRFSPFDLGLSVKHISSQLIEGLQDDAWAVDLGAHTRLFGKNTLGLSIRNIGSDLKFSQRTVPLPRNAQFGLSMPFSFFYLKGLTLVDTLYDMNSKKIIPSFALEIPVGHLALRGGLKNRDGQTEYSFGTGFGFSWFSMDYAVVMAPLIETQNKFSLNLKFGDISSRLASGLPENKIPGENKLLTKNQKDDISSAVAKQPHLNLKNNRSAIVYEVKKGETWNAIAAKFYGSAVFSHNLKIDNQHLYKTNEELKAGQHIIINRIKP